MDELTRTRLTTGLKSATPVDSLRQVVQDMKSAGNSQQEIYDLFVELLAMVRSDGTEQEDDAVRDVLDFIVGWCSPDMRLFDTTLEW